MTWHKMERRPVGGQLKTPVRVGVLGGALPALVVGINADVAKQAGLAAGDTVVLLVGADEDCGQMQIRRARDGERGIAVTTDKISRKTLRIRRSLAEWWCPRTLAPRKSQPVHAWRIAEIDGERVIAIVLPGSMTRDLRQAQEQARAVASRGKQAR